MKHRWNTDRDGENTDHHQSDCSRLAFAVINVETKVNTDPMAASGVHAVS